MADQGRVLVLEDSAVAGVLRDPRVRQHLPCLNSSYKAATSVDPGGTNCNRCARSKRELQRKAYAAAIACFGSASPAVMTEIKRLLGVTKFRVIRVVAGRRSVVEF